MTPAVREPFACPCGEVIRDGTQPLPYKARYVVDEDMAAMLDDMDLSMILKVNRAVDLYQGGADVWWRDMFQCPRCGRLFFFSATETHIFVPADDSMPHDLLNARFYPRFDGVPWMDFGDPRFDDNRQGWEEELHLEVGPGHPLEGVASRAIARRTDCDDLVLELETGEYAVVHLSWVGHVEQPPWPATELYPSIEVLLRDHYDE